MKKKAPVMMMWITGVFVIVFLVLFLTGWADTDDRVKRALRQGNRLYDSAGYGEAMKSYEAGLAVKPEDEVLNFNAAQAAYLLGEYDKADTYYKKSGKSADKYLNAGNIYFKAGEAGQDEAQQAQCFAQAMKIYEEGIREFPRDVPLKYNYEAVKAKLDELSQDREQEGEDQDQDQDQDQGQDQESENQGNGQEDQSGDSEQGESAEEDQGEGRQEPRAQDEGEDGQDQEAIERILQMLENQEEQDLKNNQEVIRGNGDKYGW